MDNLIGYSVLNNVAASAADVSLSNESVLDVANTVNDKFIPVKFNTISASSGVQKYLTANNLVNTVTYTAAANTTYEFVIIQPRPGYSTPYQKTILVRTGATFSDAAIAASILAQVNNEGLAITATGAASPVTLTGTEGFELFTAKAVSNVTIASAMTEYAENTTPADALTTVIAPHGTPATAIAGTTTVTVTTLAAHGLVPGDIVTIASAATFTMTTTNSSGITLPAQTGGTFKVATVPTTTTFTLENCVGNGGTNSGTITITAVNCVYLSLASAPATAVAVGDQISITGVATMTVAPIVNGVTGAAGTSVTARVGSVISTTLFKLDNVAAVGTNSGTIVPKLVASYGRGLGRQVILKPSLSDEAVSTNNYATITIDFNQPNGQSNVTTAEPLIQVLYVNESDADAPLFLYRLGQYIANRSFGIYPFKNVASVIGQ